MALGAGGVHSLLIICMSGRQTSSWNPGHVASYPLANSCMVEIQRSIQAASLFSGVKAATEMPHGMPMLEVCAFQQMPLTALSDGHNESALQR